MGVPSSPDWQYGYTPTPGEWNNTFAGKVDYPAPVDQGGTGAQNAYTGNYNLQQRKEVITISQTAAALTFYSVRTDLTACTLTLPLASACNAGDWVDVFDSGANAATNNITIAAGGTDTIKRNATSSGSLVARNNGARVILVTDGVNSWRAQIVSQSTGIGFAAAGIRAVTTSTTLDTSYIGYLVKVSGAGTSITLPTSGFINGNAIAFDNVDATNAVLFTTGTGDFPLILLPGDCCIVVADGAGGWWRAAYSAGSASIKQPVPKQISATSYTLQLSDQGQYLQFTAATAVTVTIPTNATVPLAIGATVVIEQYGAGQVTLVGAGGVALNSRNGLRTAGQFAVIQGKNGSNASADTWTILGDTTA